MKRSTIERCVNTSPLLESGLQWLEHPQITDQKLQEIGALASFAAAVIAKTSVACSVIHRHQKVIRNPSRVTDRDCLVPAGFARGDFDAGFGHVAQLCQPAYQMRVGFAVDRPCRYRHFQSIVKQSRDGIL